MVREGVTQTYPQAAMALNEDWGTNYQATQVQRLVEAIGQTLLTQQMAQAQAYEQGRRPKGPINDPSLLVIQMDGGRVQSCTKNPQTQSRWKEDKVLTISSYLPGDGKKKEPQPLVTTYLATMKASGEFGVLARVEAERRGIRQAAQTLVLGDGAAWIDTLCQEHFGRHVRIVDWYHAAEHLHDVARAVYPQQETPQKKLAEKLKTLLWQGQVAGMIRVLQAAGRKLGPSQPDDGPDHPRRVLAQNV